MNCLLLYDITDDAKRTRVADACLDYGLDRTQYSAFCGDISRNLQEELFLKVQAILDGTAASVLLVPICETDWDNQLAHVARSPQ